MDSLVKAPSSTPTPNLEGRGCLQGGCLGLPGRVWELRFLPSFPSFPGKIAVQETSGKEPGCLRHPSSKHPRPSDKRNPNSDGPQKLRPWSEFLLSVAWMQSPGCSKFGFFGPGTPEASEKSLERDPQGGSRRDPQSPKRVHPWVSKESETILTILRLQGALFRDSGGPALGGLFADSFRTLLGWAPKLAPLRSPVLAWTSSVFVSSNLASLSWHSSWPNGQKSETY